MIMNEKELGITREALSGFRKAKESLETNALHKSLPHSKQLIYERAIDGEINVLSNQIKEYERSTKK